MNKENVLNLLREGLRAGVISKAEVADLCNPSLPTEKEKELAELLHTMRCHKDHTKACTFYTEPEWYLVTKSKWLEDAREMASTYKAIPIEDIIELIQDTYAALRDYTPHSLGPDRMELFLDELTVYTESMTDVVEEMKEERLLAQAASMLPERETLLSRMLAPIDPTQERLER
jgi:hypothetical protein